jgi:hypothetical protein
MYIGQGDHCLSQQGLNSLKLAKTSSFAGNYLNFVENEELWLYIYIYQKLGIHTWLSINTGWFFIV